MGALDLITSTAMKYSGILLGANAVINSESPDLYWSGMGALIYFSGTLMDHYDTNHCLNLRIEDLEEKLNKEKTIK